MKQKTMVLIVLAVICGLGASFMTSKLLADRQQADDTTKVLVAKKNVNMGDVIKKPEDLFEEKDVPKDSAPKNALTKLDEAKGRQLKIPRRAGDMLTLDDLMDSNNTLNGQLPPNHRAVGIRVAPEDIAAGFAALPLSRVDISCLSRGANEKDMSTRVVLQNVLVLASDTSVVREENGKAMPCAVVTVALTLEDALKLDIAQNKGKLKLLLRPFGDNTRAKVNPQNWQSVTSGVSISEDKGTEDVAEKSAAGSIDVPVITSKSTPTPIVLAEKEKARPFVTTFRHGNETEKFTWTQDEDNQWQAAPHESIEPSPKPTPTPAQSSKRSSTSVVDPKVIPHRVLQ